MGIQLDKEDISEEMVQHSRDMFMDTCLWTHGGQICNLKSTCLIRTILDLLERVDALVLYINIQLISNIDHDPIIIHIKKSKNFKQPFLKYKGSKFSIKYILTILKYISLNLGITRKVDQQSFIGESCV